MQRLQVMFETPMLSKLNPFFLVLLSVLIAGAFLFHPASTYFSPAAMDAYFGGEVTPGSWEWTGSWSTTEEPFKYRLLFRGLVDGVAEILAVAMPRDLETYWTAFVVVSMASIVFAFLACWWFLQAAGFSVLMRWLLLAAWFFLPPIHNAFVLPVQTKEDFLAYAIFFLGLRAILVSAYSQVFFWTVLGALTRETLMLIPAVFVLGSGAPLTWKGAVCFAGVLVHLLLRAIMGVDGYEVVRSENFDTPLLAPYSVFMVLGFGWVAILGNLGPQRLAGHFRSMTVCLNPWSQGASSRTVPRDRLFATLPFVLLALLALHLGMGRIVEIRISVLLGPWVLIALGLLLSSMRAWHWPFLIAFGVCFSLFVLFEASGAVGGIREDINPLIKAFSPALWWLELYFQISLTAAMLFTVLWARRPTHSLE